MTFVTRFIERVILIPDRVKEFSLQDNFEEKWMKYSPSPKQHLDENHSHNRWWNEKKHKTSPTFPHFLLVFLDGNDRYTFIVVINRVFPDVLKHFINPNIILC